MGVAPEKIGKKSTDRALETAAKHMTLGSKDELLARLGSTEVTGTDLCMALYPELLKNQETDITPTSVIGLEPDQTRMPAPCCQPLPGERIIGIAAHGKGVKIHAIDCEALVNYEDHPELWIDLRWTEGTSRAEHDTTLEIIMANATGVLGRICTLIGEHNVNISNINFLDKKPDFFRVKFDLQVRDLEHLLHIRTAIEADSDTTSVTRLRDPSADKPDAKK